jgi:hypothetical protein
MWNDVQQALHDSTTRLVTGIAALLPGFAALFVALGISGLLAWVAGLALRRFLRGVDFDAKLSRWGWQALAEMSPSESPELLVTRMFRWGIVLLGFLVGVAAFDVTLTSRLVGQFFIYLPNLLVAIFLIVGGNVIARYFARSVLIGAVNMNLEYARLLSAGVRWLILVFATAMALNHLGVGGEIVGEAFTILFGGIVFALALAVGLGAKDLVSRSLAKQERKPAPEEQPFHHV